MLPSLTAEAVAPLTTAAGYALANVTVGAFKDSITPALTKDAYTASVDWGDGSAPTTESVVDDVASGSGRFEVLGSTHTYDASAGRRNIKITVATTSGGITRTLLLYEPVTVLPFPCSVSASFTAGTTALSVNIGAAGSLTSFLTFTQDTSGFISRNPLVGGFGVTSVDCSTTPGTVVIGGTIVSVTGTTFMPGQSYTLTLSQVSGSSVMTAQLTANGTAYPATMDSSGSSSLRFTNLIK